MEKAEENTKRAFLRATRAGKGYKLAFADGTYLFASKRHLLEVVNGERAFCVFKQITDAPEAEPRD